MAQLQDLTLNTERKCGGCKERNDNRMVECDECKAVFHLRCASFRTEECVDGNVEWRCSSCELNATQAKVEAS